MTGQNTSKSTSKRFTLCAAAVAVFVLAVPPAPAEAATCAAGSIAVRAGKAFIGAARSRSASAFANALRSHTNMRSISMFALGKYRKKLPKGSEGQYIKLTSKYVARTLVSFAKKFRASSVETVRCKGSTVETRLNQLGGRPPAKVLWRIKSGKVSDVNVQNVWLGQLLRSNFASVMKKGGGKIGALFAHLGARKETVAKLDR